MMAEETNNTQPESVKLIKNSKGYNWEIKLIGFPLLTDEDVKRLEQLDKHFKIIYGVGQGDTGKPNGNTEIPVAVEKGGTERNDNLNKLKEKSDPTHKDLKTLQC